MTEVRCRTGLPKLLAGCQKGLGGRVDDLVAFAANEVLQTLPLHFDVLAGEVDLDGPVGQNGHLEEPLDGDLA